MADEMVMLELVDAGLGFSAPMSWAGEGYIFEPGVPQMVPKAFADALISNNPQPWQTGGFATYRIVDRAATGGNE